MMELNEKGYRELMAGDKPVLVEFQAPWCVYCRRLAPALARLERQDVIVGSINIDDHPALAQVEGIEVVPTLVLYHRGEALGSIVAPDSRARIEEFLEDFLRS